MKNTYPSAQPSALKPYQQVPIQDCGEPLVPIPLEQFATESPHPYQKLGAPYGDTSPYHLRQSVLTALTAAQAHLQQQHPGWRLQIFDAYRPIAVQQFMVDHTFAQVIQSQNLNPTTLSNDQRQAIWQDVYQFWAVPNLNPLTPPPHSTGAAVDLTLIAATGEPVDMGSPIDELSVRSHPNHYRNQPEHPYHNHRELLREIMHKAGFRRHPHEWWHFSLGDQMWAWLCNQDNPTTLMSAHYGRFDP